MRTLLALLLSATPALAKSDLYGVASGILVRIDKSTGAATAIGAGIGMGAGNAAAADPSGRILTDGGPDQLIAVDTSTGLGSPHLALTGRPIGYGIRGMAFTPDGQLYTIMSQASTSTIDLLCRIDTTTGAYTTVGPTGRSDLQALASDPSGNLFAIGINTINGGLFSINKATGAATLIGGSGSFGGADQALEFDTDGTLFACQTSLRTVNPATGASTLIGPVGPYDVRGLAIVPRSTPCYANCDASTTAPILNVNDFICFQTKFAAQDPTANCDQSTTPPTLNVNDFICFQTAYAAGCP